ncbi:hypothetical protein GCM10009585_03800 [Brevibacterium paucivorans]
MSYIEVVTQTSTDGSEKFIHHPTEKHLLCTGFSTIVNNVVFVLVACVRTHKRGRESPGVTPGTDASMNPRAGAVA